MPHLPLGEVRRHFRFDQAPQLGRVVMGYCCALLERGAGHGLLSTWGSSGQPRREGRLLLADAHSGPERCLQLFGLLLQQLFSGNMCPIPQVKSVRLAGSS